MKLAMAPITLYDDMDKNLEKAISFIKQAQECDLIFFPEIQLSPFFHSMKIMTHQNISLPPTVDTLSTFAKLHGIIIYSFHRMSICSKTASHTVALIRSLALRQEQDT